MKREEKERKHVLLTTAEVFLAEISLTYVLHPLTPSLLAPELPIFHLFARCLISSARPASRHNPPHYDSTLRTCPATRQSSHSLHPYNESRGADCRVLHMRATVGHPNVDIHSLVVFVLEHFVDRHQTLSNCPSHKPKGKQTIY